MTNTMFSRIYDGKGLFTAFVHHVIHENSLYTVYSLIVIEILDCNVTVRVRVESSAVLANTLFRIISYINT